jgi:uncharacterized protein (TIGR02145 family)
MLKVTEVLLFSRSMGFLALLTISGSCKEDFNEIVNPIVTTGYAMDITGTSAKIEGNTNTSGGDHIVNRGICWSNILAEPIINADNWYWEGWGSGSYTGYMTDLTPGITYYVQAFASNSAGAGMGGVISFTTSGSITGEILFNPALTFGEVTDIDGNSYKTVEIGTQTWMAENLRTTKYNDGTTIPGITDLSAWIELETPGYCWYINDEKFKDPYGALYNWYTIGTGKLCPAGWHVPGDDEWRTLTGFLGGDSAAAGHLRETGTSHWIYENSGVTDNSGFAALPGGRRSWSDQRYFREMGYGAGFWSSNADHYDDEYALCRRMYYYGDSGSFSYEVYSKKAGLSVRCVKD